MAAKKREIGPQAGYQQMFMETSADIAIGGGAAGVGKTFALLLEFIRNTPISDFGGVIFRRTSPQIKSEGGLWDTSMQLYPLIGAEPRESDLTWKFPSGSKLKFSHLEYEKNVLDWQGSQIPFIGFDEITHFSKYMFFYLLSRNRSTCGVNPYVRATCNPDPDSWVAEFIEWWICQDEISPMYGFPIPERAGVLRYFMKDGDNIVWGDSKAEVMERCKHIIGPMLANAPYIDPNDLIKSVTFIPGDIYDNKALLSANPAYLGNLMAQDEETKAQLLFGNWKVKVGGTEIIRYEKLKDVYSNDFVPKGQMCITADIALKGSDLLIALVWDGFRLVDMDYLEYAEGNEPVDMIKRLANKWKVPNSNIVYDDDGIGQYISGFIKNIKSFKNGGSPLNGENYKYLRDQCSFKMADIINANGMYVAPEVAQRKITKGKVTKTFEQWLNDERRAIKRDKPDDDGKLRIISKDQRKNIIGRSTDIWDAIMERAYLMILKVDQKKKSPAGMFR
jgi:hypothetical protein